MQLKLVLFNCMFCSGICGISNSSGGIDICLFEVVLVVMVKYWWSSDGDRGDASCCNGGSCD